MSKTTRVNTGLLSAWDLGKSPSPGCLLHKLWSEKLYSGRLPPL